MGTQASHLDGIRHAKWPVLMAWTQPKTELVLLLAHWGDLDFFAFINYIFDIRSFIFFFLL